MVIVSGSKLTFTVNSPIFFSKELSMVFKLIAASGYYRSINAGLFGKSFWKDSGFSVTLIDLLLTILISNWASSPLM